MAPVRYFRKNAIYKIIADCDLQGYVGVTKCTINTTFTLAE